MIEFINKIEICPVTDIQSISGASITMKQDKTKDTIYSINDILPDERDSEGNINISYSQSLSVICDKLNSSLLEKYRNRKVVVKLFTDQQDQVLLGSLDFPARCSMLPKLNTDVLNFVCESPEPLLS